MGLFSKEECCLCSNKVGVLGRKKIKGGEYICNDCEESNLSVFFEPSQYDKEQVVNHIEYLKKQDQLYKEEFATLSDEQVYSFKFQFGGIVFADDIAMFEIIHPKQKNSNYKELFRYDQIRAFQRYCEEDPEKEGEYKEVGVEIIFDCMVNDFGTPSIDCRYDKAHPYLNKVRITCGKNQDSIYFTTNSVMDKLNEIFGREPDHKSVSASIKESFIGTNEERRDIQHGADILGAFGKLAKSALSKDNDALDNAKTSFMNTAVNVMDEQTGNRKKHREIADTVEKRVWG